METTSTTLLMPVSYRIFGIPASDLIIGIMGVSAVLLLIFVFSAIVVGSRSDRDHRNHHDHGRG